MKREIHYQAALYMRLSKEDAAARESASISAQRQMLRAYAKKHKFQVYKEYIDDGYSGTNFDRPAFREMLGDIESKKVNMVLTKDLSRLGRDYIVAGEYTELYFPEKGVRFIALNDGYDSDSIYGDIAPFKNVMNEMYARDTSKKIRSAFTVRMQEGAFIGNFAPYGYQKDPEDKHHLLPDKQTAPVVKEIFAMAQTGRTPSEIAAYLNQSEILSPAAYRLVRQGKEQGKPTQWTAGSVSRICRNVVYLGHMAQGKTTKVSFKTKAVVRNPEQNWYFVKNTHEPLVEKMVFYLAQKKRFGRIIKKQKGFSNIFSGIAVCASCGHAMSTVSTRKKNALANLACGQYKAYGVKACSNHFIDYESLLQIVRQEISVFLFSNEEIKKELNSCRKEEWQRNAVVSFQKKVRETDAIISRLYEDRQQGRLTPERFYRLLEKYQAEEKRAREHIYEIEQQERENTSSGKKSTVQDDGGDWLTPELLYQLVDKIEVGQGVYEAAEYGRVKQQTITIYYHFYCERKSQEYHFS